MVIILHEMVVVHRASVNHAHLRRSNIEGRQLTSCRSFGSTASKLAELTKANIALL